jgi:aerobic carbon-monoxide dehydrogenase medium subunit
MKAPPLAYVRATSLDAAFRLWDAPGDAATLLAGGQTLLATLAFRLAEHGALIDISRLPELRGISATADSIRVGAMTTHSELGVNALVRRHVPLLANAVPLIAHAAIRNLGTIGGSLAHADPAAELPACAVALDAVIIARSVRGERRIAAAQFFTGLYTTALAERELIAAIEFPLARREERSAILELARRAGDYAIAGIAAKALVEGGVLRAPKLVFFAVGDGPIAAQRAMAAIADKPVTPATVAAAQRALDLDLDPAADQHGGPEMKRQLARVLLARALELISADDAGRDA